MKILKKQGVAWAITVVMVLAAIGVGWAKAYTGPALRAAGDNFYVYDMADLLSSETEHTLSQRNRNLYDRMDVVIACVTVKDYEGDIYEYAMNCADEIDLRENDFIVIVNVTTYQAVLIQGAALEKVFPRAECVRYMKTYTEDHLNDRDFDKAFLRLTSSLADWYEDYFAG